MNYRAKVTVKNSRGNELVEIFNFTASDSMKICNLQIILNKTCKPGYHVDVLCHWRRVRKHPPMSFDELCAKLMNFRFYEVNGEGKDVIKVEWVKSFKIHTTVPFNIDTWISDMYNFTFFELTPLEESLRFSSKYFKDEFIKHGLEMFISKDPDIWYVKRPLMFQRDDNDLVVLRRVCYTKREYTVTKKEL